MNTEEHGSNFELITDITGKLWGVYCAVNSLGMCPANERRRYIVTTSLIGWAHT